jgi:serine protease Do
VSANLVAAAGYDGCARPHRLAIAIVVSAALAVLSAMPAAARSAPDSFADLAATLSPSVVNIATSQKIGGEGDTGTPEFQFPPGSPFEEFFKDFLEKNRPGTTPRPRRLQSLGSGFIIDPDGLVVTNNHVIAEADEVTVTLNDGSKLPAKVLGKDTKTDLALLKVESSKPLVAAQWGDSDHTRVGDWVLAIGNPFGLGGSVTAGIVSARGRDINAGPYDDFIQTDASINRGNSGGPLFDLDGRVIGINTAIFSPTGGSVGIGFAIPSSLARNVIEQLKEYGRTRRGWLGVRIQSVTDEIAESLGLKSAKGALVAGVSDNGPAKEAGIQQGDVILRFDGKEVEEMRSLPRIVAETRIGKDVDVRLWRKGREVALKVKIGELELSEEQQQAAATPSQPKSGDKPVESLGMTLSDITPELRERFELDEEVKGVVVTGVGADSAAAEKGIREGDVIVEVAQEQVASPQDVLQKIDRIRESKRKSVLLLLQRGGDLRFVAVRLEKS